MFVASMSSLEFSIAMMKIVLSLWSGAGAVLLHTLAPPVLPWVERARASRLTCHHAQRTGRGLGIKHNPGLFQNPRFDALMVYAQQV